MRMNFNPATNSWIAGEGFKFEILHLERNQRGSIKVRARGCQCRYQVSVAVSMAVSMVVSMAVSVPVWLCGGDLGFLQVKTCSLCTAVQVLAWALPVSLNPPSPLLHPRCPRNCCCGSSTGWYPTC